MDVLDQSVAPGVSAMNPEGLSVGTAATPLRSLARIPSLRCLDFMELNPAHDDNGRTARVAAHLFLIALSGLALGPLAQDRSP
jgi:formiminoglutamase